MIEGWVPIPRMALRWFIQDFPYRTFLENVLLSVRHLTYGDQGKQAVRKVLRMPKRGPNIISRETAASVASNGRSKYIIQYPRVHRGTHFADFMRDKRMFPEVYHAIIQRQGSNEILSWTQHSSLEEAMKNAELDLALIVGPTAAAM